MLQQRVWYWLIVSVIFFLTGDSGDVPIRCHGWCQVRNSIHGTWLEVRHESWDCDGGDMVPWWMCEGEMRTQRCGCGWDEMQLSVPGWRWDTTRMGWNANLGTWIEVRQRPWWRLYNYFGNWMEVRWVLHGAGMQFCRPGWRWPATWMELRPKSWDLDAIHMGPGWRWDTRLETLWMGVKWDLQGVEMPFSGAGWIWDATRVEVWRKYGDLDGATWMKVICDLDWGDTRI